MSPIYLDACILIYACELHPTFSPMVRRALARHEETPFAISPLTRMECLVRPVREANTGLQQYYEEVLDRLISLPMNDRVFELALQLRARQGLKTPDALHLACAQTHGCQALWTNDDRLAAAGRGLAVNVLATGAS